MGERIQREKEKLFMKLQDSWGKSLICILQHFLDGDLSCSVNFCIHLNNIAFRYRSNSRVSRKSERINYPTFSIGLPEDTFGLLFFRERFLKGWDFLFIGWFYTEREGLPLVGKWTWGQTSVRNLSFPSPVGISDSTGALHFVALLH